MRIQWLSVKNSLRQKSERLGLVAAVVTGLLWYGVWAAGALGLFALALFAGSERLALTLPGILFGVFLYWQLSPLLSASMGVSIDLRKMALYPIDVKTLFGVECLLRAMTGAEILLLLWGLLLGTLVREARQAAAAIPATLLFIVFNILLSAGLRNLLERLLQRRRFREVFVFILVMASVTPQLLVWGGTAERVARQLWEGFRFLPPSLLPSSLVARAFLGRSALGDWVVLAGWAAAAGAFGYWQFRRSFRFDFAAARSAATRQTEDRVSWPDRLYRIPARLLPDPLAAMVEKELRYVWRSPRFRLLFVMGFSFGVVAWLPFGMRGAASGEILQSSFVPLLSLYALLLIGQVTFLNSFGFDRSAARYFFWMPVSLERLLLAKNLVAGLVILIEIALLSMICRLLGMSVGGWQVLEAMVVTAVASLYLFSAGNFTSVLYPSGVSPERVSRGAGRGLQGLVVFLYPILILPVLAAYFARYYWNSLRGFVTLLAIGAVAGAALYWLTLPLAARLSHRRRERILQELSRGEGPLVTE